MNGALTPLENDRVSPLDHGLVVGDGVFETLRVYGGVPFAWTRHLARLHASAHGSRPRRRPTPTSCAPRPTPCSRRNDLTEARLRITVTGGPAPPGSRRAPVPPTVIVDGVRARTERATAST